MWWSSVRLVGWPEPESASIEMHGRPEEIRDNLETDKVGFTSLHLYWI